ncbi:seed maturation protein pm25 [Diaporthe eres]|nr:seed maturation protein pm25 [Diaporthe eres]
MADATLPKDKLKTRAVEGAPLSQEEVSAIQSEETSRTCFGAVKGGPAATAQSIHDKQQTFFQKAGDLARKPVGESTREDAAEVQKAEAQVLGGPPGAGTTSSVVQLYC